MADRWPRRSPFRPEARPGARRTLLLLLVIVLVGGSVSAALVLRSMVTEYAASAARDLVVSRVNAIVKDVMADPAFAGRPLVSLERDGDGGITAISADVAAVNTLAAEVLARAVEATEQEDLQVRIPVANLLGSAMLMNRGPAVEVDVLMLSSSSAGFRSEITSAGINQTRHQLFLDLDVQLSFLLPWRDMDTSVQTEILISETVIVGKVPDSYLNWEK